MAKNISIYPSDALGKACANNGGGRGRSHRISQIADRYSEILRRAGAVDLTPAEISLVRDACNGVIHEPAALVTGALAQGVGDAIALDGLAKKWDVDGAALVAKLRGLTYAQEVRLIEEVERYWASVKNPEAGDARAD